MSRLMDARELAELDMRACNDDHNGSRTGDYPRDVMRLVREARRLRAAIQEAIDDSDFCYLCHQHPSAGHAAECSMGERR